MKENDEGKTDGQLTEERIRSVQRMNVGASTKQTSGAKVIMAAMENES